MIESLIKLAFAALTMGGLALVLWGFPLVFPELMKQIKESRVVRNILGHA